MNLARRASGSCSTTVLEYFRRDQEAFLASDGLGFGVLLQTLQAVAKWLMLPMLECQVASCIRCNHEM